MFWRELRWFFGALLLSSLLSFIFILLLRMIETDVDSQIKFSWKLYLAGLIVMLMNIYAGRFILQSVRDRLG
jgi:hypothetical protein